MGGSLLPLNRPERPFVVGRGIGFSPKIPTARTPVRIQNHLNVDINLEWKDKIQGEMSGKRAQS